MSDLTVRFAASSPELLVALAEVVRTEPGILERDDAAEAVRDELSKLAPGVELTVDGTTWRLSGEAPAYSLAAETPEEAGLRPIDR